MKRIADHLSDRRARNKQRQIERRDRIVKVLEALPVLEEQRSSIAIEADFLVIMNGFMSINDMPRANRTGAKQAEKELARLNALLYPLIVHIYSMHKTALDAIEKQSDTCHPFVVAADLVKLADAASGGAEHLVPEQPREKTGRPRKRQAQGVTDQAARVYEKLTGRRATRAVDGVLTNKAGGPWLAFLNEIFAVCEIEASAESQAALLEKRRSKK